MLGPEDFERREGKALKGGRKVSVPKRGLSKRVTMGKKIDTSKIARDKGSSKDEKEQRQHERIEELSSG